MNTPLRKTLLVAAALFLGTGAFADPNAPLTAKQADTFAKMFNSTDSLARVAAFDQFDKQVAKDQRAGALDQIWANALVTKRTGTPKTVLAYLQRQSPTDMPWNAALSARVKDGATGDVDQRRLKVRVLDRRNTAETQAAIQSFLNDASEDVRDEALISVRRWPNRDAVYEAYIQKNTASAARQRTVQRAQFLRQKSRGVQKP